MSTPRFFSIRKYNDFPDSMLVSLRLSRICFRNDLDLHRLMSKVWSRLRELILTPTMLIFLGLQEPWRNWKVKQKSTGHWNERELPKQLRWTDVLNIPRLCKCHNSNSIKLVLLVGHLRTIPFWITSSAVPTRMTVQLLELWMVHTTRWPFPHLPSARSWKPRWRDS